MMHYGSMRLQHLCRVHAMLQQLQQSMIPMHIATSCYNLGHTLQCYINYNAYDALYYPVDFS